MKQGWEVKKLGDVCELINRGVSPKYTETNGLTVLNQKCIRNHEVNYDLARIHDNKIKPVSLEKLIKIGDVLVNSTGTGTLGRVAQIRDEPIDATVDSHITIVRPLPDVFYNDFFGYALILIEEEIAKRGEGCGGQTELARSTLKNEFNISFPKSLPEQQRIVAILDEAFAAIAQAKANAEQNLKNAKELFESYLQSVFENKGEGWEEKPLGELCELISGQHIDAKDYNFSSQGIGYLTGPSDFGPLNPVITKWTEKPKIKAQSGDILITVKGSGVGKVNILNQNEIAISRQLMAIRVTKASKAFIYAILSVKNEYFRELSTGAAIPGISRLQVLGLPIFIPSLSEQQAIVQKLDALSTETEQLETIYQQKINDLDELKKSILQKAFAGELNTTALEV